MEKELQGFEKFKEYFSNTKPEDIIDWQNGRAFIDFSWIYSKLIDREDLKKAIANIMEKNNPRYAQNARYKYNKKPEDIDGFEVIRQDGDIMLGFLGADNYTVLDVYNKDNEAFRKPNRFNKVLISDINNELVKVISGSKEVSEKQARVMLVGIEQAQEEIFENLADYYQYLSEEKKESQKHKCVIEQRTDFNTRPYIPNINPNSKIPRKNDIIPFGERKEILEKNNPITQVEVAEIGVNGTIDEKSYIAYVYTGTLKDIEQIQDGYMFVCEPNDGDRNTRIMYLTKDEYNEFGKSKKQDKVSAIVQHYLEMSTDEFCKEEGCAVLSHTNLDNYEERLQFFINGTKGKSLTNLSAYEDKMKRIYQNDSIHLPYYKRRKSMDLGIIGSSARRMDKTAQHSIIIEEMRDENGNTRVQ